jgi:hypothetical protein
MAQPSPLPATVRLDQWPAPLADLPAQHRSDAVVVLLPKPLAGLGTSRQVVGLCEGLQMGSSVPVVYVGPPASDGSDFLRTPYEAIDVVDSVPDTFASCTSTLRVALSRLAASGVRRPLVLAMGYTSFGPESVKRALESPACTSIEHATVIVVDSAFPDTSTAELDVNAEGWPCSRFYTPGFGSNDRATVAFALTSSYDYDPRVLADRVPPVDFVGVVAPPYTASYIAGLADAGRVGREQGLSQLGLWPELDDARPCDLLVPFVSSDIWSPTAVGAWMTADEYATVTRGTRVLFDSLERIAARRGVRIYVPIDAAAKQVLGDRPDESLRVIYSDGVPQADHARMLGAAELAISRTGGQANASIVLAMVDTPAFVIDLPAAGYMQAELTSAFIAQTISVADDGAITTASRSDPLGAIGRWDWTVDEMAAAIEASLDDADRPTWSANARQAFDHLISSPAGSLLSLVDDITRQS